jgi:hypothetical protein
MTATAPRDSTIAVVGDGFGSLLVYSTALYLGFRPQDVTIFGPSDVADAALKPEIPMSSSSSMSCCWQTMVLPTSAGTTT